MLSGFPWIIFMMCFWKCEMSCLCKACLQLLLHGFTQIWKWNSIATADMGKHFSRGNCSWNKQLTFKKTCLCTHRRWVYVQIPTQNKAYIISEAALVEKQKLDSHSVCTLSHMGAPTGPFPWKSRITPCFAMWSLFCPYILSWHDCGCQRRNSSLTHCQSEHH